MIISLIARGTDTRSVCVLGGRGRDGEAETETGREAKRPVDGILSAALYRLHIPDTKTQTALVPGCSCRNVFLPSL